MRTQVIGDYSHFAIDSIYTTVTTAMSIALKFIAVGIPEMCTIAIEKYNWFICDKTDKERGYTVYQVGDDKLTPLFLIHGRFGKMSSFDAFAKHLKEAGFGGKIVAIDVSVCDRNYIEHGAKRVDDIIKKALSIGILSASRKVSLVGHSQGGVIAAYYNESFAGKSITVKGIATIASPLLGTRMAYFSDKQTYEELTYKSVFATNLNKQIRQSKTPYYFVKAFFDYFVEPTRASSIPKGTPAENQQTYVGWGGHGTVKRVYSIARDISMWLNSL